MKRFGLIFAGLLSLSSLGLWAQYQVMTTANGVSVTMDTAQIPNFLSPGIYTAGSKQTFTPNLLVAAVNLSPGPLPTQPLPGDLHIDSTGAFWHYFGTNWYAHATVAVPSSLTAGLPLMGNGGNSITVGTVTGAGSIVLSSVPTLINPVITSYINGQHNHSNAANGGPIANTAFSGSVTFANLPICSASTEGSRGAISDSTVATWGTVITGGGTHHVLGYCDGTNWTVAAI
jgi:hypothetical protein